MNKPKKFKSIVLATSLALTLSLSVTVNAYAASPATYAAVSGDSLFKIGQIFNTSVDNLMKINNLKSTSLNIGQELNVPCETYTVQKGDTLFLIAQKYKISFNAIKRANNIYTDNLNIGQTIILPTVSATNTTVSATNATVSSSNSVSQAPSITPTSTTAPSTETAYSASDLDLLSRLICAEAVGEPYDAKVAIGAVVMNRVESGLFADTIKGVIYQNINGYYQFTPVVNGWIDKPADADSIKAAKEALNGVDPTNGAIWYYDNTTTNQWIRSKPVAISIGNMIFAY